MTEFNRRKFLEGSAGVAAAATLGTGTALFPALAQAQTLALKPEKGAKLRVLRWSRFVQGDIDQYMKNVAAFTAKTGIEVRVDNEGWEDVRPKAAVAANTGAGPDIILSTNDDANLYPDKLLDVTDVAEYIGKKYGGWYPAGEAFLKPDGKKWIGLPLGSAGAMIVYRESMVKAAGFDTFPKDTDGLPEADEGPEGEGHAGRHGARQRDRRRPVVQLADLGVRRQAGRPEQQGRDRQPGDAEGARVRQGALRDLHPRHAVVARSEQQQGVPRRPDLADEQRHLDLLRGEELDRSEGQGNGGRHPARVVSDRAGRACRPNRTCSSTRW